MLRDFAGGTGTTEKVINNDPNATKDLDLVYLPIIAPPASLEQCDYAPFRGESTPIVLDNGSSTLRYGFARDPTTGGANINPFGGTNVSSRFKDRKSNRPVLLFGESVEFDSGARSQARTPWEGDVLLNFDALVCSYNVECLQRRELTRI